MLEIRPAFDEIERESNFHLQAKISEVETPLMVNF